MRADSPGMDCSRARTKSPSEWLELAPEYSKPLVAQLADWILTWESDLEESIKWNTLCFSGRKLVCALSACKAHAGVTFFRGTELADPAKLFNDRDKNNTNIRSFRITSLDALNRDAFRALLRAAVDLDADPMIPPAPKVKRKPWPMPGFFKHALAQEKHRSARDKFRKLSRSSQREYLVWLSMAKRPETRQLRLKQTLVALSQGRKWAHRKLV